MNIYKIINQTSNSDFLSSTILSFYIVSLLLVYFFINKTKHLIFNSEQAKLFDEYYLENRWQNLHIDMIFSLVYVFTIILIYKYLNNKVNMNNLVLLLIISVLVISLLDFMFSKYIRLNKNDSKIKDFFERWIKAAGSKAVIWDIIYILSILFISLLLLKYNLNTEIYTILLVFVGYLLYIFY